MRKRWTAGLALAGLLLAACSHAAPHPANPTPSPPATATPSATANSSDAPPASDATDWPTYHGDRARTGVASGFPTPTAPLRLVASVKLDGAVYASPIVARGLTVVATEQDSVYALDPAGRLRWRTHLGTPSRRSDLPCGDIDPTGITGTPVYDKASGLVFAVAEYRAPVRHELVALDLQTGTVRWRMSVDLPGADPSAMQQRAALTISAGRVWVAFGGRAGDCGDYTGRLIGVPLDGRGAPLAFTVPTAREGGIWTPPGPSVDANGHLFISVGNGAAGPGDAYDHSDSVLELDPATARMLDSFSPTSWASDNDGDLDLGSQGPALVGDTWVFIAGKSGNAYVLRQGRLGGIGGQVSTGTVCESYGGTAVDGDVVYVPCSDGVRAVRIDGNGRMQVLWQAGESVAGSPVVGGDRVWAVDRDANSLYALDPATGRPLGQVVVGPLSRFATPALSAGRVLVPTLTGLAIVAP